MSTATIQMAVHGMSANGSFGVTVKDLDGNVVFAVPAPQAGSFQATRITA